MQVGPLGRAYTRYEMLQELRSTQKILQGADNGDYSLKIGSSTEIFIPDEASAKNVVKLDLPRLTCSHPISGQIKSGPWKSAFFLVLSPDGRYNNETIIRKASFPNINLPLGRIEVEEVRLIPGNEPHYMRYDFAAGNPLPVFIPSWPEEPQDELWSNQAQIAKAKNRAAVLIEEAQALKNSITN